MGKKKEGICGDGSQRFEPNLPLSEANLKIIEGGIAGISAAGTMGLWRSQICQSRANTKSGKPTLLLWNMLHKLGLV
jgi:hypothetical protein